MGCGCGKKKRDLKSGRAARTPARRNRNFNRPRSSTARRPVANTSSPVRTMEARQTEDA